jgi:hypothetical protein
VHGSLNISNVVFAGFNSSDCGMPSVAIRNNPTQVLDYDRTPQITHKQIMTLLLRWSPPQIDYVPSVYMQGIRWVSTPRQARFYLGPNDVVGPLLLFLQVHLP